MNITQEMIMDVCEAGMQFFAVADSEGDVKSVHSFREQADAEANTLAKLYAGMMFFVVEIDARARHQFIDGSMTIISH